MVHKDKVLEKLKKQVKLSGNVSQWARLNDVSPQYVHDVLSGRRDPGKKILDALGYSAIKTYVKVG